MLKKNYVNVRKTLMQKKKKINLKLFSMVILNNRLEKSCMCDGGLRLNCRAVSCGSEPESTLSTEAFRARPK